MTDQSELTPERKQRRERIRELSRVGIELYTALQANAAERDALIVAEMADGAVARELAEITGLTVGRIYRLRDNGMKRE